jgi:hypothetical protein
MGDRLAHEMMLELFNNTWINLRLPMHCIVHCVRGAFVVKLPTLCCILFELPLLDATASLPL